jgi:hypothetical protein
MLTVARTCSRGLLLCWLGQPVSQALLRRTGGMDGSAALSAVLVSRPRPRPAELPASVVFTADPEAFFAADWQVFIS